MRNSIKANIFPSETHYMAECLEIGVVKQGRTVDETIASLKDAVALFLEGEDPANYEPWPIPFPPHQYVNKALR